MQRAVVGKDERRRSLPASEEREEGAAGLTGAPGDTWKWELARDPNNAARAGGRQLCLAGCERRSQFRLARVADRLLIDQSSRRQEHLSTPQAPASPYRP